MSDCITPQNFILTSQDRCNFSSVGVWINRYVFPSSFLFLATAQNNTPATIRLYENIILGTASASYLAISSDDSRTILQPYNSTIRYIDWLITTPFLALIIYEYAISQERRNGSSSIERDFRDWWFAGLPIVMVIAGYLALISEDLQVKIFFFILSWLALLTLFYLIYELSRRVNLRGLQYFFYLGWSIYGLAFLIPDYCTRAAVYNTLDFFNKVIFSFYITLLFLYP